MTLLVEQEPDLAETLAFAVGGQVTVVDAVHEVARRLEQDPAELLVVLGPHVEQTLAFGLAEDLRLNRPHVGVVLLRRRVDVVVMGHALRAGVREVVDPEDLTALGAACSRSLEISRRHAGTGGLSADAPPEGRVVTVFSAKGGCGKTTIATNLAATLAGGGAASVCIVDLDLAFGDVAIALQLVPARTITDTSAMVGTMDEQGVRSLITPHSPGLDTLLAPTEPGQAERIDVKVVAELVRVLRRMYDFVVIDTPPAFSEHVLAAFDASDCYVLLATLDIPALKNLRLTLEMLELLGYPQASWLVTLNRSDSKVGLGIDEVERTLRVPIAVQIPSSRAVPASVNRGVPLVLDEPSHAVSQAVRQLADIVVERVGSTPHQPQHQAQSVRRGRGLSILRRGGSR
ncbi:MAG: AAA family ATPase [Actinomycetota bacterium]|nr:AAA family ATPase [Actinomycetota bacterium]